MSAYPACILCDTKKAKVIMAKNSYFLIKCQGCGLISVSLDHPLSKSDLQACYDKEYFTGRVYKNYFEERNFRLRLFERKFDLVKRYFPRSGRLLDIGAAAGFFLEVARRNSFETYGVEISKPAATYATKTLKLKVFAGELEDARFSNEYFDVITMWDVLEHLPRPVGTLRIVNRLLRRGGVLVIETLNTACVNAKVMGRRWPLYLPPVHLFYFSLGTLRMLLSKTGFKIIGAIPVQTYSPFHQHKAIRYFVKSRAPLNVLLRFFGDVVIVVCTKQA